MPKTNVVVNLSDSDGNVFVLIDKTTRALKREGFRDLANQFLDEAFQAASYDAVFQLIMEYVDVV